MRASLRRFRAVALKEFIHVLRDPRALGVSIALPLVMLLLFGYALTLDVDRVPLAVWDQSRTPQSRELVSKFEGSRYFALSHRVQSYAEVGEVLDRSQVQMALILPTDFGPRVASGRTVEVQILADGSDANTTTLALGYADAIIRGHSQALLVKRMQRASAKIPETPLDLRTRAWFNTDLESRIFIVPGLIAVIIMLIAALLTSLTVAREWETGTMEQLVSTPVKAPELILGKLVPYFVIGMLDMVLSVVAGYYLFEVPMRGSLILLFGVSAMYILGSLGLGILISSLTKTQLLASQLAFVATFLPAFLLSGFMFDIANIPVVLQRITFAVPARYFISFLRALYLKGMGLEALWRECLFLALFALGTLGLAVATFKKRLG
ncbi:MAG: ABC transporter permease [Holophaga sp.]|nr:ABC transporter permease [Holophaga sp.]